MSFVLLFIALAALAMGRSSILGIQCSQAHPTVGCNLPVGSPARAVTVQRASSSSNQPGSNAQIGLESKSQVETSTFPMGKIIIRKMPVVAPRGIHSARFVGAENVTQTETGELCNRLVVTVEFSHNKDGSIRTFKVSKAYNLDGRGAAAFSEDYTAWSGVTLTPEDLDGFDPDSLLVNKLAKVEITHRVDGKELVPVIAAFHPAEVVEPTAA